LTLATARRWALPALILFAALLRLVTLGEQSLWLDEVATATAVRQPFSDMLRTVGLVETTPALFYAVTWAWTHVFGNSDFSLRMVAALAGIAVIPVAFAYGRRLAGERAGWVLAAIATVHPLLVWYSQDARSYSMALLFGSLGWLAFLRVLDEPRQQNVVWWALASGAAAVTHYTTVYFVVAQGIYILIVRPRVRGPVVVAGAGLAIIGLALGPMAATVDDARTGWIKFVPLGDRLESAVRDGLAGPSLPTWHPALYVALLAGLAALPVVWRSDRRRILTPAVLALVGLGIGLLVREGGGDYILGRNLIPAWLPLWAVAATGLAALPSARLTAAAATPLCALLLVITVVDLTDDRQQRPDWRAVAEALEPARKGRVIVGTGEYSSRPLAYYLPALERPPGAPLTATDVVLVTPNTHGFNRGCGGGALCGLFPARIPKEPVPGLRRVSVRRVANGRFFLALYRAKDPVSIDDGTLPRFGQQDYSAGPTLAFVEP
jgi:4-amino-4-deoxy-L-arabinose transferase-like glycosyltransferase